MNVVIMRLALRALLGSRRVWILVGLSALLFAVAGLTRWGSGGAVDVSTGVIVNFGFGLLVPIMCLLIGTGVIAPEIEDGSIVYLLAKPRSAAHDRAVEARGGDGRRRGLLRGLDRGRGRDRRR